MLVKDYIKLIDCEDFYCYSDHTICFEYIHITKRKRKIKIEEETHSAINLCHKSKWKNYASYNRFANREIVKIEGNYIFTKWTMEELIKEYQELTEKTIVHVNWYRNDVTHKIECEDIEVI